MTDSNPTSHARPTCSSCGAYISNGTVACTTHPDREIRLVREFTYDLVVRGPRIPFITAPVIESARVSLAQLRTHETEFEPSATGDAGFDAKINALSEPFTVENMRAFDYEQPPFGITCEASRQVMSTQGLQMVTPAVQMSYSHRPRA